MCKEKDKTRLPDILAYIMILVCVIGLFVSARILFERPRKTEVIVRLHPADSLKQDYVLSAADAVALFQEIEKKEMHLEERYNYVLEQSEHEFQWQTFISIIISVIVAICGFFGYKSIKDLQEEVRGDSKRIAEDTAKEVAKSIAEETATSVAKSVAEETAKEVAKKVADNAAKIVAEETSKAEVSRLMPDEVQQYLNEHLQTHVHNSVTTIYESEIYNSIEQKLVSYIDQKIAESKKSKKKKEDTDHETVLTSIEKADEAGKELFKKK